MVNAKNFIIVRVMVKKSESDFIMWMDILYCYV